MSFPEIFLLQMQDGTSREVLADEMTQEYGFLVFQTNGVPFYGVRVDTVRTWMNRSIKHKPIKIYAEKSTHGKKTTGR